MEKHLIEQAANKYSETIGASKKDSTLCKMAKMDFEAGANWALSLPPKDINSLREELTSDDETFLIKLASKYEHDRDCKMMVYGGPFDHCDCNKSIIRERVKELINRLKS